MPLRRGYSQLAHWPKLGRNKIPQILKIRHKKASQNWEAFLFYGLALFKALQSQLPHQ